MSNYLRPFSYIPAPTRVFMSGALGEAQPLSGEGLSFSDVGGIMVPNNMFTLGSFQGLQRAINALISKTPITSPVSVDGEIGPRTLAALQRCMENLLADFSPTEVACLSANYIPQAVNIAAYQARCYAANLAEYGTFSTNFEPVPSQAGRNAKLQIATGSSGGSSSSSSPSSSDSPSPSPSRGFPVAKALLVGALVGGAAWWAMRKNKRGSTMRMTRRRSF